MNLLANILRNVHVIHAIYNGANFDFHLLEISIDKNGVKTDKYLKDMTLSDISGKKFDAPLVLTISGKGVISKIYKENSEELKRITEQPNDFLFASENVGDGMLKLTFLRRNLYDILCEELNIENFTLVEVRIDANNNPEQEARKAAEDFWTSKFSIKEAFAPSIRSSSLLSLVAKKVSLPVLLFLIVVLLINFFVQQNIANQLQEQQIRLAQTKRNTAQVEKNLGEKQQILNQLSNEPRFSYAWIADQIASVVPDEIILTELEIQPLKDRIQENKPVNVEKNKILIKGQSLNPASVTDFTDSIQVLGAFGPVQLTMHNKDRNDHYLFTLDVSL